MNYNKEETGIALPKGTKNIPVLKIRMMSDDEWNRLAYRNRQERRVTADV